MVMVLGALAYRSVKKRRLGIKPDTKVRRGGEIALLTVALLLVILQRDFFTVRWYANPFVNVVIPVWVLMAYALIFFRKQRLPAR